MRRHMYCDRFSDEWVSAQFVRWKQLAHGHAVRLPPPKQGRSVQRTTCTTQKVRHCATRDIQRTACNVQVRLPLPKQGCYTHMLHFASQSLPPRHARPVPTDPARLKWERVFGGCAPVSTGVTAASCLLSREHTAATVHLIHNSPSRAVLPQSEGTAAGRAADRGGAADPAWIDVRSSARGADGSALRVPR